MEHFTAQGYNVCFKEVTVKLINTINDEIVYKGWQSSSTRLFYYFDIKEIMKINYMDKKLIRIRNRNNKLQYFIHRNNN